MLGKICVKPVITARADMTVAEAARLMRAKRVGALVVVNGQRPVGLLTDRDVAIGVVGRGKDPSAVQVREVMARKPTVIREDLGLLDAAALFGRTGVRRIPVVNKGGKMVGIIALDDVLMLLGREMGHVASGIARGLSRAAV
ncbi:MAG: hypothetical protein A3G97_01215 [Candidatus Rokubacteria bacterium RIFCSPLOWO2_12_FULL_69_21]|nr:MAG: hypothetical protein A3G97_01215 [Candidatus Rokubacteria bacterium RIFCSPLOWO2_12_FULL_69_21]